MKTETELQKIIVQWIEILENGEPIVQTRRYNNAEKAEAFCDKLYERGVKNFTKNTIEKISIIDENNK